MRTTVDIDSDLLALAKHLAREKEQPLGRVVSELMRKGLQPARLAGSRRGRIPVLPRKPGARPVTATAVHELLEADV